MQGKGDRLIFLMQEMRESTSKMFELFLVGGQLFEGSRMECVGSKGQLICIWMIDPILKKDIGPAII
jgi:hypothetical protein